MGQGWSFSSTTKTLVWKKMQKGESVPYTIHQMEREMKCQNSNRRDVNRCHLFWCKIKFEPVWSSPFLWLSLPLVVGSRAAAVVPGVQQPREPDRRRGLTLNFTKVNRQPQWSQGWGMYGMFYFRSVASPLETGLMEAQTIRLVQKKTAIHIYKNWNEGKQKVKKCGKNTSFILCISQQSNPGWGS